MAGILGAYDRALKVNNIYLDTHMNTIID